LVYLSIDNKNKPVHIPVHVARSMCIWKKQNKGKTSKKTTKKKKKAL